jgi:hypothetical protein
VLSGICQSKEISARQLDPVTERERFTPDGDNPSKSKTGTEGGAVYCSRLGEKRSVKR